MRPAPFPVAERTKYCAPQCASYSKPSLSKVRNCGCWQDGNGRRSALTREGSKARSHPLDYAKRCLAARSCQHFSRGSAEHPWQPAAAVRHSLQSLEDLLISLEAEGMLLRLDPQVWASKYRCATVSQSELTALRSIQDVVRLGRVEAITADQLRLNKGALQIEDNSLFVDCTANGLSNRPIQPIFTEGRITLQSVAMCQQVYSASLIAHVQLNFSSDQEKNDLCTVIPHPETIDDYLYALRMGAVNAVRWGKSIGKWIRKARLSFNSHIPMWRILLKRSELIKYTSASATNLSRLAKQRADTQKFAALGRLNWLILW